MISTSKDFCTENAAANIKLLYVTLLRLFGFISGMLGANEIEKRFEPFYAHPSASVGFEDVTLVSRENRHVTINACIFASVNPWCHQLLLTAQGEDTMHIVIPEMSLEDLIK